MSPVSENKRSLWKYLDCFRPMLKHVFFVIVGIVNLSLFTQAQNTPSKSTTDTVQYLTLDQCIVYALEHQPALMQSLINVSIAHKTNAINLSAWLPQVNFAAPFTHYIQLPTIFAVNPADPAGPRLQEASGVYNTLIPQLSATETLFSPAVLYAAQSAHLYVEAAKQANDSSKISTIATVSKAFYNLLLTLEQINVLKEDTTRLSKNLKDTYHQYIGGLVDKTDYKEASITLNNSKAQLKQAKENVRPQYAILKQLMGFPPEKDFNVNFDTAQMMQEITIDTAQQLKYEKRIEFQQLQTAKSLQHEVINYYRSSFLPSLSTFYNYYYEYENNSFSNLFSQAYPYSYVGVTLSIPLFTGFYRIENIQKAKLQAQQLDWAEVGLKSEIYSEYTSALANYKGNLYDLHLLQDNVAMAKDVYEVVSLQYKQGVVAYLNVITAESDLISSEISYLNALFQVLSNKVDLEKAMGNIPTK